MDMNPRARRAGDRDESVDVDIDIDVDVDVEVDASAHAGDAFDEAPTAERAGVRPRPASRADQLRRLALVGMRVSQLVQKLNNSTSALLEYAHILSDAPATQPVSRRAVAAVQQEAEQCVALARSVAELATASDARPAPVTAEGLLRQAVRIAQPEGERPGRIAFASREPLPALVVRGHDVAVALSHIVQNALDATDRDGAVALAAAAASRRGRAGITLSVTDSGPGIPSADLAHIFEPFFTTRAGSGHAGLGLAVARAIVDVEGGQIEIESGAGNGTTVRVWLPIPEERPERLRAQSGTRVKRQP